MNIYREITPLHEQDVFVLLDSISNGFDYPIHSHPEYELNLVLGISGMRIVGDSKEEYQDFDLVLLGPYLYHKWSGDEYVNGKKINYRVITIQFSIDLLDGPFFKKERFNRIRRMMENSVRGIKFSGIESEQATDIILNLTQDNGMNNIIDFLRLLDTLSQCKNFQYLASEGFSPTKLTWDSRRIQTVYSYIITHFGNYNLKIEDVAGLINMSDSAFSHFFRKYTNKSFTDFLTDIRIGNVCRMLFDSDDTISEIAYKSGFNNIANFNRLFKKKRGCTPNEYRMSHREAIVFDWTNQVTPWQFLPPQSKDLPSIGPNEYSTNLLHV